MFVGAARPRGLESSHALTAQAAETEVSRSFSLGQQVRPVLHDPSAACTRADRTALGDCSEVISTHRHQRATIGWVHTVHNLNHKPKLADNREHKNCHFSVIFY